MSRLLQDYRYRVMILRNILSVTLNMNDFFVYYRHNLNLNTHRSFYDVATCIVDKVKAQNVACSYHTQVLSIHAQFTRVN